jgi:hypothetical protein
MIFVTGDIHRELDIHKINPREFEMGNHLTDKDYLIICGDFGCIWDGGSGDAFWLKWLNSLPWNTVFVDGNHENFDVLNQYPIVDWHGGKARQIRDNVHHLLRGEMYDIDGRSVFCFGGGFSHDAHLRREHESWWQDEIPTKEEAKHAMDTLRACGGKADIIISHDVPASHPFANVYPSDLSRYDDSRTDIHEVLEAVDKACSAPLWFSGHYHQDAVYEASGKTYVTLFDRVINLDALSQELADLPRL